MNAQQLRNSILQEAISGRLVPQDPNDEPASVLLERIRKEKQQLVKEGRLKKKDLVETPISEDEKPFDIPESWEWVRLGDVSSLIGGFAFKSHEYTPTGSRVIRISDISEEGFINKTIVRYPFNEKLQQYRIYKGDILMAMTGGTVGKSLYVKVLPEESMLLNQRVAIIRVNALVIDYIDFVIKSQHIQSIITDSKNSTNDNISMADIYNFPIPLPPLAEQKRIVEKIEELMPKVEEYGKAQEKLNKLNEELPERLKKSILQEAISGRLVPQDPNDEPAYVLLERIRKEKQQLVKEGRLKKKDLVETPISEEEIPFAIPESWEWCRISSFAAVLGGKRIPAGRKLTEKNTGHIYIRVSDMKEDTVSKDNLLYVPEDIYPSIARYIINKDDVYITVAGTIGRVGKIPPELNGANLTENADRLIFSNINQDWLIRCLQSHFIQMQISDVTTKVGQPKLAILRIQNLFIPLPPLAEQKRIVEKIEQLFAEIEKLKK